MFCNFCSCTDAWVISKTETQTTDRLLKINWTDFKFFLRNSATITITRLRLRLHLVGLLFGFCQANLRY
jgi:hypothetical protein